MLELTGAGWSAGRESPVSGVELVLPSGSTAAFLNLGREQSGKLLSVLTGRGKLDAGKARLAGQSLPESGRRRDAVVVVGPGGARPSGQTVRAELGRANAGALIEIMELSVAAGGRVRDADAPTRVRLALACALGRKTGLIVLDRALEGLTQRDAHTAAHALSAALATRPTAALVLNDSLAAARLGAFLMVFENGRVIQSGEASDVAAHPLSLAVAMATASPRLNVLKLIMGGGVGRLADGSRFTPPPGLGLPEQGECTLAFQPDDLARERCDGAALRFVAREDGPDSSGYARITFAGSAWLAPPGAAARPGRLVNMFVPRHCVMLFDERGQAL